MKTWRMMGMFWAGLVLVHGLQGQEPVPAKEWVQAMEPRQWSFPRDHGMHPDHRTEWWYFTGNLADERGKRYGYQFTIFRHGLSYEPTFPQSRWAIRDIFFAHAALTDVARGTFSFAERVSRGSLGMANFSTNGMSGHVEDWRLSTVDEQQERYRIEMKDERFGFELEVRPLKPLVLQGEAGLSRKSPEPGNASHYYSYTRLATEGKLLIGEEQVAVTGLSWFDHEFSTSSLAKNQAGWDWFSLQLETGEELMLYQMRRLDGTHDPASSGTWIDREGVAQPLVEEDFKINPTRRWKNPNGVYYPSKWNVVVPKHQLELEVVPVMEDQELRLEKLGMLNYWEGACVVVGKKGGEKVNGRGYVEMSGYATPLGRGLKE